jgi:hypothetical protein
VVFFIDGFATVQMPKGNRQERQGRQDSRLLAVFLGVLGGLAVKK